MSAAKHRKVVFEPESLTWDFCNLSKEFEVNVSDYKKWIQLLEPLHENNNPNFRMLSSNHSIPLHFERTATTGSRTIYLRFLRCIPQNGNRCKQYSTRAPEECTCDIMFDKLRFWIPSNDTSCWVDIDLYVKDSETRELMHIHTSKDNFISSKTPCQIQLKIINNSQYGERCYGIEQPDKKRIMFEKIIKDNQLSVILKLTVLHPSLELNMPMLKDADSLKQMCLKIAEKTITPSNSVKAYLISNSLKIDTMKEKATKCIRENLTAVMSSKTYLQANKENPKEMCELFSSIFGSKR